MPRTYSYSLRSDLLRVHEGVSMEGRLPPPLLYRGDRGRGHGHRAHGGQILHGLPGVLKTRLRAYRIYSELIGPPA